MFLSAAAFNGMTYVSPKDIQTQQIKHLQTAVLWKMKFLPYFQHPPDSQRTSWALFFCVWLFFILLFSFLSPWTTKNIDLWVLSSASKSVSYFEEQLFFIYIKCHFLLSQQWPCWLMFVFREGGGPVVLKSNKTEMWALNCLCTLALSGELDSLRVSYSKLFEAGNWNNQCGH